MKTKKNHHPQPSSDFDLPQPCFLPNKSRVQSRGRVSFDNLISVRSYDTVLGDNPTVCNGPPISIGWKFTTEKLTMTMLDDIDTDFDTQDSFSTTSHSTTMSRKRKPGDYYLDAVTRVARLRNSGVPDQEMEAAIVEVERVQRLRRANAEKRLTIMTTKVRSEMMDLRKTSPSTNASIDAEKLLVGMKRSIRGGLLTWATTPQRSRFSLEPSSTRPQQSPTSTWLSDQRNHSFHAKTPFPNRHLRIRSTLDLSFETIFPENVYNNSVYGLAKDKGKIKY